MVQQQFESLGTNVVVIFPGSQQQGGVRQGMGTVQSLVPDDADALVSHCPTVLAASPIEMGVGQVIYGNSNWAPNELLGVNATYLTIRNWALARGSFFTDSDINASSKVCVIGHTLVEKLFQTTDPVGQTIRIKRVPFTVIGVLERKGANMVGQDQDNIVMAPFTTVK